MIFSRSSLFEIDVTCLLPTFTTFHLVFRILHWRVESIICFTTRNTLMHDGLPMTFQKIIIECSHLWRFNPKVIDIWRLVKLWSQMDVTNYFSTCVVNLWQTHGEVTDKSSNMALMWASTAFLRVMLTAWLEARGLAPGRWDLPDGVRWGS